MDEPREKSKKHFSFARRVAAALILIFIVVVVFADFIAPYDYAAQSRQAISAPPSTIRFRDSEGNFERPFIYSRRLADPLTYRYDESETEKYPIGLFVQGDPYRLFGLIQTRTHLFGVSSEDPAAPRLHFLGTDVLGRDRFSRLLIAIRFSLLVCPIGAALACLIGVLIGLVSGYANRIIDTILMGASDSMLALPTLVLILAARAAFPLELPPMRAAMLLILIFALTGWASMARLTRGVVRSLKEMEFVLAARSIGLSELRVLFRHILPNAAPVLITQTLIMLPYFLLSEVALSFLGVGLQEPEPSLGNMLAAASDITQLARQPFLLLSPAIAIFLFVLAIRMIADEKQATGSEATR
jgi:peptide/nickel transport system permease protein